MGRCGVVCLSIVDCVLGWKIGLAALSWVELSLGRRVERGELRELQTIKRNGLCGKLEMEVRCWISRGLASLRSPMLDPSLVLSWISACCWWILSVAVSSGRERKDQTLFEFRQLGVRWGCAIGEVRRRENDTVLLSLFEMRSQDILFRPLQLVWCGVVWYDKTYGPGSSDDNALWCSKMRRSSWMFGETDPKTTNPSTTKKKTPPLLPNFQIPGELGHDPQSPSYTIEKGPLPGSPANILHINHDTTPAQSQGPPTNILHIYHCYKNPAMHNSFSSAIYQCI